MARQMDLALMWMGELDGCQWRIRTRVLRKFDLSERSEFVVGMGPKNGTVGRLEDFAVQPRAVSPAQHRRRRRRDARRAGVCGRSCAARRGQRRVTRLTVDRGESPRGGLLAVGGPARGSDRQAESVRRGVFELMRRAGDGGGRGTAEPSPKHAADVGRLNLYGFRHSQQGSTPNERKGNG